MILGWIEALTGRALSAWIWNSLDDARQTGLLAPVVYGRPACHCVKHGGIRYFCSEDK
jgi:hypothetical protein